MLLALAIAGWLPSTPERATREQLDALAAESKSAGIWVEGPVDQGGDIGSYVFVRDPNGHIWEYTWGQPFNGL